MSPMKATLRRRARIAGREIYVLRLAATDPRVPWHARRPGIGIVACALRPIPAAMRGDLRRQAAAKADSDSSFASIIIQ